MTGFSGFYSDRRHRGYFSHYPLYKPLIYKVFKELKHRQTGAKYAQIR